VTKDGRKHFAARFSDVELHRWLARAGLTPRKSLTLGPLEFPNEYWSDVVRGLLDGDGSVAIQKRPGRRDQLKAVFVSASRRHVEWLKAIVYGELEIEGKIRRRVRKKRDDGLSSAIAERIRAISSWLCMRALKTSGWNGSLFAGRGTRVRLVFRSTRRIGDGLNPSPMQLVRLGQLLESMRPPKW
jgi:LAGLIDADG DNA endonuclease family protein